MPIIHLLQRIASLVPTHEAMLVVLLATTLAVALYARIRMPNGLKRHRLALGSVALGTATLLLVRYGVLPIPVVVGLLVAVTAGFAAHTITEARQADDDAAEEVPRKGALAVWVGVASAVLVLFLVADLGGYADALLAWEPESSMGLVEAHKANVPIHAFAAKRLLWDQGVVSSGHHSLLYGTGTYAMWRLAGVSTTTLRLMSVLLAIACLPIAYMVGKETGSSRVATSAVVVMAINPIFIFYGRYGSSLAATFFGVLLMLWAFERLSDPTGQRMWIGFTAAAAAYLATLAYSPARVVTAAVVTTSVAVGAWNWRRLAPRRRQAFGLLAVTLAALWMVQETAGTADNFVTANSEQVFSFAPEQVREHFGEELDVGQMTTVQRRVMAANVFRRAVRDYGRTLSASFDHSSTSINVLYEDPPHLPLTQGPLLLFALWGMVRSLAHTRRGWPLMLLAFLAAATLPLLLTTRVDTHRLSIAIVPIILWAGIGVIAADRVARGCGLPLMTRHAIAAIFIVLAAASNSTFLFSSDTTDRSQLKANILAEIAESPYPVALALDGDFSLASEFRLNFFGRQRNDEVLPEKIVRGLRQDPEFDPYALALTLEKLHCAMLIFAPRELFEDVADLLQERGTPARSTGDPATGLLRLDPVDEHGDRVSERLDLQSVTLPLTDELMEYFSDSDQTRFRLAPDLEIDRDFESEEPRFDEAWNGEPMIMGGLRYLMGVGMHTDTSIKFAVPSRAVAFESVIGLTDDTQDCDGARVVFELWDDTGRRIFASEPRATGDAPQLIHVPLGSTTTVELVVTDAGEHHPCGHGNWADPVFVLSGC